MTEITEHLVVLLVGMGLGVMWRGTVCLFVGAFLCLRCMWKVFRYPKRAQLFVLWTQQWFRTFVQKLYRIGL